MSGADAGAPTPVSFHANAESPTAPGEKSCLSDPLDHCCGDAGAFFEELAQLVLDPLPDGLDRSLLREVAVEERGPSERFVRIVLDGGQLKARGLKGEDSDDRDVLHSCVKFAVSRERLEIVVSIYDPGDGATLRRTHTTRLLQDPLRVETWVVAADGSRHAGGDIAKTAEEEYLRPVLRTLQTQKVPVHWNVASPQGGGPCAITGGLDDYLSYDDLFRGLLTTIKRDALSEGATIDYPSGKEVEISYPGGGQSEESPRALKVLHHDAASGEIAIDSFVGERHVSKTRYRIHRQPDLRAEAYVETSAGVRLAGKSEGRALRALIHRLIDGVGSVGT